jgi:hypothetical protein
MEDPYFRDMAKTRWLWLRENRLSNETVHQMIDSLVTWIAPARERNYERWPILGTYVWPNYDWAGNDYDDEVEYFEDFLFPRLNWMDQNFPGQTLEPTAGISADNDQLHFVLYSDFFSTHLLKPEHFILNNTPVGVVINSVDYTKRSECTLLMSEDVSSASNLTVTIKEEAVNYWLDITSGPLSAAGFSDVKPTLPEISIFTADKLLHIRCDRPELLPESGEIFSLAGQRLITVQLQKYSENIIRHKLLPGLYLFFIISETGPLTVKFII